MRVKQKRVGIMQSVQSGFQLRKRFTHLLRKHGVFGRMT